MIALVPFLRRMLFFTRAALLLTSPTLMNECSATSRQPSRPHLCPSKPDTAAALVARYGTPALHTKLSLKASHAVRLNACNGRSRLALHAHTSSCAVPPACVRVPVLHPASRLVHGRRTLRRDGVGLVLIRRTHSHTHAPAAAQVVYGSIYHLLLVMALWAYYKAVFTKPTAVSSKVRDSSTPPVLTSEEALALTSSLSFFPYCSGTLLRRSGTRSPTTSVCRGKGWPFGTLHLLHSISSPSDVTRPPFLNATPATNPIPHTHISGAKRDAAQTKAASRHAQRVSK